MPAKSLFRAIIALILLSAFAFASIGRISVVNGDVSIERGVKSEKAISNFQLEEKDVIKSKTGATAQLIFNDKTVITVGSNTTFKIEEYLFGEKNNKARFNVAEGSFKTITGKIAKVAPEKFKIETKTATIGIRGTIFLGNIDPMGVLTIACTKGAIELISVVPTIPPVLVKQGQMTTATPKSVEPPKTYTPTQLQNLEKSLAPAGRQGQATSDSTGSTSGVTFASNVAPPSQTPQSATSTVSNTVGSSVNEAKTTEKVTTVTKTVETVSCQPGYTGTHPNYVAPACPAGYTGTYPNCTAPTCQAGYTGTYPNCVAPACQAGYTGTYPNCVAPACPTGHTGTYPNCVAPTCPTGYTGTYPNCVAPTCPTGHTGTYPNCTAPTCPTGHTGTYPNCTAPTCPTGYTGTYPNCTAPTCPTGYTGTYPNCVAPACPSGHTGTYPNCTAQTCPTGYTGTYPNCVAPACPAGYSGLYPNCIAVSCPTGYTGVYPACVAPVCPSGYTGTYPDCVASSCPTGYTGVYPACVAPVCPSGYTGTYPDCVASTCPSGYTGTYPNCVATTQSTLFSALPASGSYLASSNSYYSMFLNMSRKVAVLMDAKHATNTINSIFIANPIIDDNTYAKIQTGAGYATIDGAFTNPSLAGDFTGSSSISANTTLNGTSATYGPFVSMSNIASSYNGYSSSGGYPLSGYSTGFQVKGSEIGALNTATTGKYGLEGTVSGAGIFSSATISGMSINSDIAGHTLSLGSSSALISEDIWGASFAATSGGVTDISTSTSYPVDATRSYMVSMPDYYNSSTASWIIKDDYSSWGYWKTDANGADLAQFGFWVAGTPTMQSDIDALKATSTSSVYVGNIMGAVLPVGGGAIDLIDIYNTNQVALFISFGSSTSSINGTMNFKTQSGKTWGATVGGTTATSFTLTPATASFGVSAAGLTGTGNGVSIIGGTMKGGFYGNGAQSVGGNFHLSTGVEKASGVFKATK